MTGANRAGRAAEETLAGFMRSIGLEFQQQVVMGRTIYGKRLHVDLLVTNLIAYSRGLAIESKWQDANGSIDEKFPYLVENIQQCYPVPAIVVVHGGGVCPGALKWLRARVDGEQLVAVHGLEGFMSWAL